MQERIKYCDVNPDAIKGLLMITEFIKQSDLDHKLFELVKIRASQINGCAFCLDMHTKDARRLGETEQRIYTLNAWRETRYFTDAERAALALTEHMTEIATKRVPNEVYDEMTRHFSPQQIIEIMMAIVSINGWNRIAIASNFIPA